MGTPELSATHLGWWALQYTPRVALLHDAVVLELEASESLFGGRQALLQRVIRGAMALGVRAWAQAQTALAAVALAHHPSDTSNTDAPDDALGHPLASRLDALPLDVLPGVATHATTLARMGCRKLADLRALPRGGLSRRFGADLLLALDQAYGLRPQAFEWLPLPPVFEARLELPGRVEHAAALLQAATRLLQQLCAWLAGRQAGVTAFTLRWLHDWHRRDSSKEGEWTVRVASPTRDLARLRRLLAEHLSRIELHAPVGDLALHAVDIVSMPTEDASLFAEHRCAPGATGPDALQSASAQRAQREALLALLEQLTARLGADHVRQGQVCADHRPECAQRWAPALTTRQAGPLPVRSHAHATKVADLPQPSWMLDEPLPLALDHEQGEHPVYQGRLHLLAGPHRIEAGWWDERAGHARVTRDYYLASSPHAGLLWVFRTPASPDERRSPWFLHGFFA
jgi:protein ImuB